MPDRPTIAMLEYVKRASKTYRNNQTREWMPRNVLMCTDQIRLIRYVTNRELEF